MIIATELIRRKTWGFWPTSFQGLFLPERYRTGDIMKLLSLVAATLALSAASAPAAFALQTEFIAKGTVYGSGDPGGVFGPAGSSLDGDSFTADFYINTSVGTFYDDHGLYQTVYGGTSYNDLSPVSATLTIDNISYYFDGTSDGDTYVEGNKFYGGAVSGFAQDEHGDYLEVSVGNDSPVGYPNQFGQPFFVSAPYSFPDANFGIYNTDGKYSTFGSLDVSTVTDITSAAPEPSAWALLMFGVGVVGSALRRTRKAVGPPTGNAAA